METDDNLKPPQWLKELQESSWELELLISGGAIFSLFQFSDLIISAHQSLKATTSIAGMNMLLVVCMLAIKILTMGFVLHLVLRTFWLSKVCINYVYPRGINFERVRQKRPFKTNTGNGSDLYDEIIAIDKLCGLVIYLSIITLVTLVGMLFIIIVFISLPFTLWPSFFDFFSHNGEIYTNTFLCLYFAYLFDFISIGLLRRIPFLNYLLFPVFKIFDIISLRKYYNKSLLLLNTNIKRSKFYISISVFFVIAIILAYLSVCRTMHWPNIFDKRTYKYQMSDNKTFISRANYLDQLDGDKIVSVAIQSQFVTEPYLNVVSVYNESVDYWMDKLPGKKEEKFLSDLIKLSIDDSTYANIEWFKTYTKDRDQYGVSAVIPIEHLSKGKHILVIETTIKKEVMDSAPPEIFRPYKEIVFWKCY